MNRLGKNWFRPIVSSTKYQSRMLRKISTLLLLCFAGSWASAQVISSFPFFENFESQTTLNPGCNPSYTFGPGTWRNGDNAAPPIATHTLDWVTLSGPTGSGGTGPSIDHTLGNAAGKYVYMEASCTAVREADLVSPYLDLTGTNGLVLDYWYHMWGASGTLMHVDVDTTQGQGAWVLDVTPPYTDNLDLWQNKVVNLSAFTGLDSVRIRIRGVTPAGTFTHDYALDDILIYVPAPFDLSAMALSGVASGCGIDTQSVTFNGFQNGTDTLMAGDTIMLTYQLNGAGAVTEPYILTAPIAPGGSYSYTFSVVANFSTPGNYLVQAWSSYAPDTQNGNDTSSVVVVSIPVLSGYPVIYEDFESGGIGWTQGGTGSFALGTPSAPIINSAASGTNAWVTNLTGTYAANEDNWVESPCFDLSQYCNPYLRLSVWWNAEFSWDGANVQYSTDGGTSWNLVGINGDPNNWYNDNTILVGVDKGEA